MRHKLALLFSVVVAVLLASLGPLGPAGPTTTMTTRRPPIR